MSILNQLQIQKTIKYIDLGLYNDLVDLEDKINKLDSLDKSTKFDLLTNSKQLYTAYKDLENLTEE